MKVGHVNVAGVQCTCLFLLDVVKGSIQRDAVALKGKVFILTTQNTGMFCKGRPGNRIWLPTGARVRTPAKGPK